MIARLLKRTLLTWGVGILLFALVLGVWMRRPLYFTYLLHQHYSDIARKQKWLSHDIDAAAVARELRRFASEQRWNRPEKTTAKEDFFYHDDTRLPEAVRSLHPSWVQISDDRIDVGCGEVDREVSHSYGLSVWRDPHATGYGTKKLGDGIWYYEQTYRTHDFGSDD